METILDLQLPRKIGIQLSGARWAGADVLAVYGERLMRLEGKTGEVLWEGELGYYVHLMESDEKILAMVTEEKSPRLHVYRARDGKELGSWSPPYGLKIGAIAIAGDGEVLVATGINLSVVAASGVRYIRSSRDDDNELLDIKEVPTQHAALIICDDTGCRALMEFETGVDACSIASSPNHFAIGTAVGTVIWLESHTFKMLGHTECGVYADGIDTERAEGEAEFRKLRWLMGDRSSLQCHILGLTSAWSRRPPAYAPASLRLPGAAHARRSAARCGTTLHVIVTERHHTTMQIHLVDVVAPVVVATLFIGATSTFQEPQRRNFNAIMVAGAGAAYLNGGLGIWEFAFSAVLTSCAYKGLNSYGFIGLGWILHTGWDAMHHLYGNPIVPFVPTSSLGCAICDPMIAAWCFAGAPAVYGLATKRNLTTSGPGLG